MNPDDLLTISEIALIMGVPRQNVYAYFQRGHLEITPVSKDGPYLFKWSQVEQALATFQEPRAGAPRKHHTTK